MTKTETKDLLFTTLHINLPSTGRSEIQQKIYSEIEHLLDTAIENITSTGITLSEGTQSEPYSHAESNLIIMYAAWLYRGRIEQLDMPRSLKFALNNMLISQKASV